MPVPPRLILESVMPKILACTMRKHYVVGEVGLTDVEIQCGRWGYDESFIRLWHYYLCYCEAGFDEGYLGDLQLVMAGPNWHDQVTVDQLPRITPI